MGRVDAGRAARAVMCAMALMLVWWLAPPMAPAGISHATAQEGVVAPDVIVPDAVPQDVVAPDVVVPDAVPQNFLVRVPILTYHGVDYSGSEHSVTPEQLHAQCLWLIENGYTAITLWQFWDAVASGTTLPPNPVILTHDDGSPSALTFADILGQYGLVGNYFINNVSALTPDQILSLSQRGPVQAHTVSHASLAGLDYESQLAEISQNKAYLEQITGQSVVFLAWPFGASDASAAQAAAAAGIVAAFGLNGTAAQIGALDPYYVPRIMMGGGDLSLFASAVTAW